MTEQAFLRSSRILFYFQQQLASKEVRAELVKQLEATVLAATLGTRAVSLLRKALLLYVSMYMLVVASTLNADDVSQVQSQGPHVLRGIGEVFRLRA